MFPAPYNTQGIRLTNASDCAGSTDCVNYVGYSYWRRINNHVGSDTMLIVLGLNRARGGAGPTLFQYNKVTDEVTNLGTLFDSTSPFSWATAETWYFSTTLPTKLYVNDGPTLLRYDVITKTLETVFDVNSNPALFGTNRYIWQTHSSNDDQVHSGTLKDSATYADLGCFAYKEGTKQFFYFPQKGYDYDECQIDKSGRWLLIKEKLGIDSASQIDNHIIDLTTGVEMDLLDRNGAGGHSDDGYGYIVAADNWNTLPNAIRLWKFGTSPLGPGTVVYYDPQWTPQSVQHMSHVNTTTLLAPEQQYVCGSGADSNNGPRVNEIVCFLLDGSLRVLVVAPVMTDMNATGGGDTYSKLPKGNLDVTGQYFIWTSNVGTSRLDAFLVKVPAHLLTSGATDSTPPTVSIMAPLSGTTIAGLVTVSATADDSVGVAGVQFKLDGMILGAEVTTTPYTVSWDSATASNETHTLTATARDAAGNSATSSAVTVAVNNTTTDITPPTASIASPLNGETVSGTITVAASVSDNVGVVGVQFKLDSVNLGAEVTIAPYVLSWNAAMASNGTHSLTTVARDAAGNTATSSAITVTVSNLSGGSGTPDPTLLPVATISQIPLTSAYNALTVPSIPAGSSYRDPTTNVKIYKLTSPSFPTSSPNWGHDYAEGGDEVSLPYNGNTRALLVRQNGGSWWLIDFTPGVGVSNPRQLAGNFAPFMDIAFSFSNNPATPYYAYVSSGSTIRRFDIRTMTEVPGNGWPVTGETSAMWLHQSENDGMFVWLRGANGSTMVAFEPGTNTKKTYTNSGMNEPRIDRAGRYVGLSMDTPYQAIYVWDWNTNSVSWTTPGTPGIPFSHNASLRRRWITADWNMSYPPDFTMFIPDVPNSAQHIGGPANATLVHCNGNWIQYPASLNDQWAMCTHYGSLRPLESYWLAPGGMVLLTPNGQRRLLGHPYNTTSDYTYFSFAKFSPDGRYVLFTSDMNGSGRSDVFLAEMPSGTSDTTPPTGSITAPSNGATVSGSAVTVSATASDNVGVVGVQLKLDGANLGAEDTSAPFSISWNTTLASDGPHSLTAVARDAAGNQTTSAAVSVTVSNTANTTAPVISSVNSSGITSSGATVTWATNEASDSQVEYGPTTAYGSSTALNTSLVTAHSQGLSGLSANTLYHYRVMSRDAAGNLAVSADFTFTTAASADAVAYRASVPATVDGVLSEWSGATAVSFSGRTNGATAYVLWDSTNLYLAFKVLDTKLSATRTARDAAGLHLDDGVEVYLDTRNDRTGTMQSDDYQFLVNLRNVQGDLRGTGSGKDAGWNAAWQSAVKLQGTLNSNANTDSWSIVEIAIPWAQIGVSPVSDMVFGIDLAVNDRDPNSTPSFDYFDWAGIAPNSYNQPNLWKRIRLTNMPPPLADTTPPVLSAVSASRITSDAATIGWTTDETGDSKVEYGATTAYGSSTALNTSLVTAHSQGLIGLSANTLYHYRVKSKDASGNLATSGDFTLTTQVASSSGPQNVIWSNLVNVTATGNTLRKTSGCGGCDDAGAVSSQTIASGDGYVEFTVGETNSFWYGGLSRGNQGTAFDEIGFAFRFNSAGGADVSESGVYKGGDTPYAVGDVFRVAVEAGQVTFRKNGVLLYTSVTAPTYPLLLDTALGTINGTVQNAMISLSP